MLAEIVFNSCDLACLNRIVTLKFELCKDREFRILALGVSNFELQSLKFQEVNCLIVSILTLTENSKEI